MTRRPAYPAPRWQTPLPPGVAGSWGPDVDAWAVEYLGIRLDRWQRRALDRALAIGPDGRLVHRTYLVSTARQNGKTAIVRSLIGWALTAARTPDWQHVIGLAHDRKQARIPYRAVLADLAPVRRRLGPRAAGALRLTQYLGIRSDLYGRHREYDIGSREAANAIRGTTNDLGLFDEVRTQIDDTTWAALEPTTTTRPEPLILATSTAGNDRSWLLREWLDRGRRIIEGIEPAEGFGMTWYAAPDDLAPDDPRAWLAANPSIADGRLDPDVIRQAYRSLGASSFRMERLNLFADAVDEWLPAGLWARTVAGAPLATGRTVLGVDVVPTWRRATIVATTTTDDGAWFGVAGELVAGRTVDGTVSPADVIARLADLARTWRPAAIAYSSSAAIAPHLDAWTAEHDVRAIGLGPRQLRQASELFRSELVGGRLTHADDPLLARQARDARPSKPMETGDWFVSTQESAGDVDAIRAAIWATWAAIAPPEPPEPPAQVFL